MSKSIIIIIWFLVKLEMRNFFCNKLHQNYVFITYFNTKRVTFFFRLYFIADNKYHNYKYIVNFSVTVLFYNIINNIIITLILHSSSYIFSSYYHSYILRKMFYWINWNHDWKNGWISIFYYISYSAAVSSIAYFGTPYC